MRSARLILADGDAIMIKLRVEWRQRCSNCGTHIIVDFLDESVKYQKCPWCGHVDDIVPCNEHDNLRDYLSQATRELEENANCKVAVK